MYRPKHVEQLKNIGIINSTTQWHLVGSFCEIHKYKLHVVTVAEISFVILNNYSKCPPSVSLHVQAGIWMCISITSVMVDGSVFVVRNTGHPDLQTSTSSILIYVTTWEISCVIKKSVSFIIINHNQERQLTLRLLMSYIYIYIYIYGAPILDVSRSHTTTQHSR